MGYRFKSEIEELYKNINVKELRNKEVLITGANGLIGSFLTNFFVYLNDVHKYNITIYVTSLSECLDFCQNLKHLNNKIEYFSWDASEPIKTHFVEFLDFVFYCAGYSDIEKYSLDISKTALVHTFGVNNILRTLKDKKEAKFILLGPDFESNEINGELEAFINAKKVGRSIAESYANDLNVIIVALTGGVSDDKYHPKSMFITEAIEKILLKTLVDEEENF